jgi:hypothetical protein
VCGHEQLCILGAAPHAANIRLKEIKKLRTLIGKQNVELLTNLAGKRAVVVLNPSFFTSLIASSLKSFPRG